MAFQGQAYRGFQARVSLAFQALVEFQGFLDTVVYQVLVVSQDSVALAVFRA